MNGEGVGASILGGIESFPSPVIVGIRLCGGQSTEQLALALFRLNEHDTDLGLITPDGLACSGRLARDYEIEHRGNAGCSLNFQARASLGDIPNHARDRMLSEKDFPGLQHSTTRRWLPSIHERLSSLWAGGWIIPPPRGHCTGIRRGVQGITERRTRRRGRPYPTRYAPQSLHGRRPILSDMPDGAVAIKIL